MVDGLQGDAGVDEGQFAMIGPLDEMDELLDDLTWQSIEMNPEMDNYACGEKDSDQLRKSGVMKDIATQCCQKQRAAKGRKQYRVIIS